MMKKISVLMIMIFSFVNCQVRNDKDKPELGSKQKDINEIVAAIIVQDSLNIYKSDSNPKALCIELKKISVEIPVKQENGLVIPPVPGNIYITQLLHNEINGEIFFSAKDSLYILTQNSYPEKWKIDNVESWNLTKYQNEMIKRKNGERYQFYELTIPIFSADHNKVYVELGYYCGGLCGSGTFYYLKKSGGKWEIVSKGRSWIS